MLLETAFPTDKFRTHRKFIVICTVYLKNINLKMSQYLTIIRRKQSEYCGVEGIIPQYSLSLRRIIVLV